MIKEKRLSPLGVKALEAILGERKAIVTGAGRAYSRFIVRNRYPQQELSGADASAASLGLLRARARLAQATTLLEQQTPPKKTPLAKLMNGAKRVSSLTFPHLH